MRNARSTAKGVERTDSHETMATSTSASRKPTSGDNTIASNVFDSPLQTTAERPALAMPPPTRPPIRACELLDGIPSRPGDQVPDNGANQRSEDHLRVNHVRIDDSGADGIGDMQAEYQKGDEVEEGRPKHRVLRPQHAGRDDGRDRIRCVVQSVQEIEQQRDGDQADKDRKTKWRPQRGPALYLLDDDAVDLVGYVIEAVGDLLQVIVDLDADNEVHRHWRCGASGKAPSGRYRADHRHGLRACPVPR